MESFDLSVSAAVNVLTVVCFYISFLFLCIFCPQIVFSGIFFYSADAFQTVRNVQLLVSSPAFVECLLPGDTSDTFNCFMRRRFHFQSLWKTFIRNDLLTVTEEKKKEKEKEKASHFSFIKSASQKVNMANIWCVFLLNSAISAG